MKLGKNVILILSISLISCGVTTFQRAKANEPGEITCGLGISGGGMVLSGNGGVPLGDFGPYMHVGIVKNLEIGAIVSPFALIGFTSFAAHVKYQFMTKPCGSLILGGGIAGPFTMDISQGSSGMSTLTSAVLFGDQAFYGPKIVYMNVNESGSYASDQHIFAAGFTFGGTTTGNFKAIIELNALVAMRLRGSNITWGPGGAMGLGIQYDF